MESNFKNINRALNEENPEIPEYLAWEKMEQGIFEKMESLSKPSKPSKKIKAKSNARALELIATVMVLVILVLSILNLRAFQASLDSTPREGAPLSTMELLSQTKPDSAAIPTKVDATIASQLKANENNLENISLPDSSSIQPLASPVALNPINQVIINNELVNYSSQAIASTKNEVSIQNLVRVETPKNKSLNLGLESSQNLMPTELRLLASNDWDSFSYTNQNALLDSSVNDAPAAALGRFKPGLGYSNRLTLEGGLAWWNPSYISKVQMESQYERSLISFQLQASYLRPWREKYFYTVGLQYQQLESVFDYKEELSDYIVVLEDTIIRVENDIVSGRQTPIYGDVEARASAERHVIHYNQSRMLKAFGTFGRSWQFKSFQGDLYLGAAINTLVNNNGRLLYEEQILTYNGVENTAFSNLYKIDGLVGFRLLYPLNHKLSISSSIQWQKSLLDWGATNNRSLYPSSFGVQMGLSWRVL